MKKLDSSPHRILIVAPNWIGDSVMAQPLLQRLKQQQPDDLIDVLCTPAVSAVWHAMQEVTQVIETSFVHGALQLRQRWQVARQLRLAQYAAAYVLPNTIKFALIPWWAGIPRRVGYKGESRYGLINVMHHNSVNPQRPVIPYYAALSDSPGTPAGPISAYPAPRLQVSDQAINDACERAGINSSQRFLVFAPGAEFGSAKRWPTAHFAELAKQIRQVDPDLQILLLGSSSNRDVCEKIVRLSEGTRSLAGATQLHDAIALLARADAVVGNDSGLLHIAAGLNRSVIGLYGSTDPLHAPPVADVAKSIFLGLPCAPCKQRNCPLGHRNCMRDIKPDRVWSELKEMLTVMPR
ncbi:MAG: lipopolysaccharide heptosyltransferase II [Alphaproteobacteria bacterium]|nr:lipopolysaccharide heptosyltransferase II [Alphaproteobacteria bacterium]